MWSEKSGCAVDPGRTYTQVGTPHMCAPEALPQRLDAVFLLGLVRSIPRRVPKKFWLDVRKATLAFGEAEFQTSLGHLFFSNSMVSGIRTRIGRVRAWHAALKQSTYLT